MYLFKMVLRKIGSLSNPNTLLISSLGVASISQKSLNIIISNFSEKSVKRKQMYCSQVKQKLCIMLQDL